MSEGGLRIRLEGFTCGRKAGADRVVLSFGWAGRQGGFKEVTFRDLNDRRSGQAQVWEELSRWRTDRWKGS